MGFSKTSIIGDFAVEYRNMRASVAHLERLGWGVESVKASNAIASIATPSSIALMSNLEAAWQGVDIF
jgi:hypothetical protein